MSEQIVHSRIQLPLELHTQLVTENSNKRKVTGKKSTLHDFMLEIIEQGATVAEGPELEACYQKVAAEANKKKVSITKGNFLRALVSEFGNKITLKTVEKYVPSA